MSTDDLATQASTTGRNVSASILRRVKRRQQEQVAIDTVDRCAMAMGVRIEDIYGEA